MTVFGLRRHHAAAVTACVLGLGVGDAAASDPPRPLVLSGIPTPTPHQSVEVFYGATKVLPANPAVSEAKVVESRPRVEAPVYVPFIPTPLWGSGRSPDPVVQARAEMPAAPQSPINALATAALNRLLPQSRPASASTSAPTIIVLREPAAEPRALPTVPAAPNVVVVREPAPEVRTESNGVHIRTEWLIGGAAVATAAFAGLAGAVLVLSRGGRPAPIPAPVLPVPAGPPHDPATDGPLLMGKYKVGLLPEPAETFEVGPTYAEEVQAKKRQEAETADAVVAHILAQNVIMLDDAVEPAVVAHETPADTSPIREPLDLPFEDDPSVTASAPIPV